jgi:hypothetical protein
MTFPYKLSHRKRESLNLRPSPTSGVKTYGRSCFAGSRGDKEAWERAGRCRWPVYKNRCRRKACRGESSDAADVQRRGVIRPRRRVKNARLYSWVDMKLCLSSRPHPEEEMKLASVRRVSSLERQLSRLEEENCRLKQQLEQPVWGHTHTRREIHRSYRRELAAVSPSEAEYQTSADDSLRRRLEGTRKG